ncbi:MAG: peptidyl-prolyl cis-trans isomerase [Opitutales bacterium]|nr:peptidyl-prolyl cis-trans isomerase [Opitutales bacterium]
MIPFPPQTGRNACLTLGLLALLAGCGGPAEDEVVIARVAGEPVTLTEFEEWLVFQGHSPDAEASARRFDAFIEHRIHLAEARRRGLHENPEMQQRFERMLAQTIRTEIEESLPAPAEPPEDELRARYEAGADTFRVPGRVRTAVIFIDAPATMDAAARAEHRARAESIRSELADLPSGDRTRRFAELAARHSAHQPTRYRGGDLGWWVEETEFPEWPGGVVEAAFDLQEPGGLSPVIDTDDGFYLLRLIERDEARQRSFEEVRPQLTRDWIRDTRRQAEERSREALRERHAVETWPERLGRARPAQTEDP